MRNYRHAFEAIASMSARWIFVLSAAVCSIIVTLPFSSSGVEAWTIPVVSPTIAHRPNARFVVDQNPNPSLLESRFDRFYHDSTSALASTTTESVTIVEDSVSSSTKNNYDDESNQSKEVRPHLIFPGGGLFFYWQAGVITYLREQGYLLNGPHGATVAGASAGALTATLTATNVDFYEAMELALDMCREVGVWDRPQGLQGIWGPVIRNWLETLLPEQDKAVAMAHEAELSLIVTQIPLLQKERIDVFESRDDLIECNLASVHIPWFLDSKWTATLRGKPYVDGSFWLFQDPQLFLPKRKNEINSPNNDNQDRNILVVDYSKDPQFQDRTLLDAVKVITPDSIRQILEQGKQYAKRMEEEGQFEFLSKQKLE